MRLFYGLMAFGFLGLMLLAAMWVGFYIVLPLVLLFILGSAITSLLSVFMPKENKKHSQTHTRKMHQNQVIDVDFEEIKE